MLVIQNGKEICTGTPEQITTNGEVIECYLGDSDDA
ncbi:MAG: hypothetical protein KAH09_08245 [Desulfobacula sp.]|nr:hypothetical protein [Desulfobacula sp.]